MPQSQKQNDDQLDLAGARTIKRFRVAREGQTVDGRQLTQQVLLDMAATYNPVEYTARINVEHMSGWGGLDSDYCPALGDVIAVDCQQETFVIEGASVELMCLYATLSALPKLVEANKNGQKIFTSIEYYSKFADTGRAYLVGVAVTDVPASRGVEPLKFNKTNSDTLISQKQELTLMPEFNSNPHPLSDIADIPTPDGEITTLTTTESSVNPSTNAAGDAVVDGFFAKLKTVFSTQPKGMHQAEQNAIIESFSTVNDSLKQSAADYASLKQLYTVMSQDLAELKSGLTSQEHFTPTPLSTGSNHRELSEY